MGGLSLALLFQTTRSLLQVSPSSNCSGWCPLLALGAYTTRVARELERSARDVVPVLVTMAAEQGSW